MPGTEVGLPRTQLCDERQRRRLVGLCAAITGDPNAAEDLAQETLLEAWRNAHKLYDPAGLERWLSAIARHVCRRWARRCGRDPELLAPEQVPDVAGVGLDVELELDRTELADLLDRALALLPSTTREVLVHRYVHESPYAEIAARFGLTVDAVSMRVSRGKVVLRGLLETQLHEEASAFGLVEGAAGGWRETNRWCEECGGRKLVMRRQPPPGVVSFRCPGCSRDPDAAASLFSLANPVFARLVSELVRPTAILARTAEWVHRYYTAGTASGQVECTRCARLVALQRVFPAGGEPDGRGCPGVLAVCDACGEAVSSSMRGLALALPEVRDFRRDHSRLRALPTSEVEHAGVPATVVPFEDVRANARIDVVFARDTMRALAVHGAPA